MKRLFKITSVLIIQAMVLGNFTCAPVLFAQTTGEATLAPELSLTMSSLQDSFSSTARLQIIQQLRSENWVEARNAAEQVSRENIVEAEDALISLLESNKVGLLKTLAITLGDIKSKKATKKIIEIFLNTKHNMRFRDVHLSILDFMGQVATEEAMLFLVEVLNDEEIGVILKKEAAKNLRYFHKRRAVEALIDFMDQSQSMATREALASLAYTAQFEDLKKIEKLVRKNMKPKKRTEFDAILDKEGFGDNANYLHWLSVYGTIEKIRNRVAPRTFVMGDLKVSIDEKKYEKNYLKLRAKFKQNGRDSWTEQKEQKAWRNADIAERYLDNDTVEYLNKKSFFVLENEEEHPDVQAVIDVLKANEISFYRAKNGLLMPQKKSNLVHWSKDGSVLIPTEEGYMPFAFPADRFPVRGETASISDKEPLLIVSEAAKVPLELVQKFPELNIKTIPHGFVTFRLPSGEEVLIATSHIDCVFEVIPGRITYDKRPIIMIDPRYHEELMLKNSTKEFLESLKEKYKAKIVVIPEEEAYLNPANYILLKDDRIIMNKAPRTIKLLSEAGLRPEFLITLEQEVTSLAPLKGMIGCLGGIYTKDRIPVNVESTYQEIFPAGIPTIEDTADYDRDFEAIDEKLLLNSGRVYYRTGFSGFLTRNIPLERGSRVLDFGTGTGINSIFAAKKGAEVVALDNDDLSIELAEHNIQWFGLEDRIKLIKSDGYKGLDSKSKFNIIASFPPKYTDEKRKTNKAIDDQNGEFIKMLLSGAEEFLSEDGKVVVLYKDDPRSITRLKELGFENGLLITRRAKWGRDERLRQYYQGMGFRWACSADMSFVREMIDKAGYDSWSVFTFEKIEDFKKRNDYSFLEKFDSEVNTMDRSKPISFVTNELGYGLAVKDIQGISAADVYLGVGVGGQNLSYIAQAKPRLSIIVDHNSYITKIYLPIIGVFLAKAKNRFEFLSLLSSRPVDLNTINPEKDFLAFVFSQPASSYDKAMHESTYDMIIKRALPVELHKEAKYFWDKFGKGKDAFEFSSLLSLMADPYDKHGWLSTEEKFQTIKRLWQEGRIKAITAAWEGEKIRDLGRNLREKGMQVSILYVSNVATYGWHETVFESFKKNIAYLPKADDAIMIDADFQLLHTRVRKISDFVSKHYSGRIVEEMDDLRKRNRFERIIEQAI